MRNMNRKEFLQKSALAGAGLVLSPHISLWARNNSAYGTAVNISEIKNGEDLFAYIQRRAGGMDLKLYRQLIGAANSYSLAKTPRPFLKLRTGRLAISKNLCLKNHSRKSRN